MYSVVSESDTYFELFGTIRFFIFESRITYWPRVCNAVGSVKSSMRVLEKTPSFHVEPPPVIDVISLFSVISRKNVQPDHAAPSIDVTPCGILNERRDTQALNMVLRLFVLLHTFASSATVALLMSKRSEEHTSELQSPDH